MDARERRLKRQVLGGNSPGNLKLIGVVSRCAIDNHLWYKRCPQNSCAHRAHIAGANTRRMRERRNMWVLVVRARCVRGARAAAVCAPARCAATFDSVFAFGSSCALEYCLSLIFII
jgi:hypothetical protein